MSTRPRVEHREPYVFHPHHRLLVDRFVKICFQPLYEIERWCTSRLWHRPIGQPQIDHHLRPRLATGHVRAEQSTELGLGSELLQRSRR